MSHNLIIKYYLKQEAFITTSHSKTNLKFFQILKNIFQLSIKILLTLLYNYLG